MTRSRSRKVATLPKAAPRTEMLVSGESGGERRILSISPDPEDHNALRHILQGHGWQISTVRTCSDATSHLVVQPAPIIVCEKEIADGTWKDVLNLVLPSTPPPVLIVSSRIADDYLWAEVLNLGGFDVLSKPFNEQEVQHVMTSAWSAVSGPAHACAAGR